MTETLANAYDCKIDGICYNLSGDSATVVYGSGSNMNYVSIPSSITYQDNVYSVTDIGNGAFTGTSIMWATISNGVKRIAYRAFAGCSSLSEITLPNSIEFIGQNAFENCKRLKAIEFPDFDITAWCIHSPNYMDNPVVRSGGHLYTNYSEKQEILQIKVPDSFTELGDRTFDGFKYVTSIEIPNSVNKIGNDCFRDCSSLKEIEIPEGVTDISDGTFARCISLEEITIPNSVSTITYYGFVKPFEGCTNLKTVYFNSIFKQRSEFGDIDPDLGFIFGSQVENYIVGKNVTKIGSSLFWSCYNMKKLVLEGNVTDIGDGVFQHCNSLNTIEINSKEIGSWFNSLSSVSSIILGDNIEIIGDYAFSDCTGLTSLNLPTSLKHIGSFAFNGCTKLISISIPNNVTIIGNSAFKNCTGLSNIIIPNSVVSIGASAFAGCLQLAEVTLLEGNLTDIGDEVFSLSALTTIALPDGVKKIGNKAFMDCKLLTDVTMTNSIDTIGTSAFAGCENLKNITLSQSLKQISDGLFQGCTGLSAIDIPSNITLIGVNAFENCSKIVSINIPGSLKTIGQDAFLGCNSLNKLIVPDIKSWCGITFATDNSYYNTTTSNPLSIAHHLYSDDNKEIIDLVIPEGVENVNNYAFYGGSNLKSVTIPSSLKSFGTKSFNGCDALSKVIVPDVASWCNIYFGNNPLWNASHLYSDAETEITVLTIPYGVNQISSGAFKNAISIKSINLPNSLTEIGSDAFYGCSSLKSLTLPNGIEEIGSNAFNYCNSLEKLVIPNSVKFIDSYAFGNCMNLYSVTSLINMPFKLNERAFQYAGADYNTDVIYMAATLYVPRGKMVMYQMTEGWQKFLNVMETDTKFKLTYILDGEEYKTYEVQATEVITPEPEPYKEGYIFSGWSEVPYLMPAQDVIVTGHFTIDPNGIEGISKDDTLSKEFFTIDGFRSNSMRRGLNIIRMSDGSVHKVMAK